MKIKSTLPYLREKVSELENKRGHQPSDEITTDHLYWMIDSVEKMDDESKMNRWIGFIHGVLVAFNICTIDELRKVVENSLRE